ncbi:hypothetical protein AV940_17220 [Alteromonas sp. Mac2]|nr:hypothetical protein AV939_17520 [Alteromonas sp. Mac1]AMJ92067.1 hypothetical protein AV940_17220 [Alteromonas sp. Mac2]
MKGVGGVFSLDNHASKRAYDINPENESLFGFRNKLAMYALGSNHYQLVMGHTIFSDRLYEAFKDECEFFTIVRDPVKRFISHYTFNKAKKSGHFKNEMAFDDFLTSKEAEDVGSFYLRYFAGIERRLDLNAAKENSHKFSVIGDLNDVVGFANNVSERYGIDLQVGVENVNPSLSTSSKEITKEQMERVYELCQKDIEIYNYIKSNFHG